MEIYCSELGKGATSGGGSISTELILCGAGVRSILLLPPVAKCLEIIDVCIWRMFVFMSVVVDCVGSVAVVINSVF